MIARIARFCCSLWDGIKSFFKGMVNAAKKTWNSSPVLAARSIIRDTFRTIHKNFVPIGIGVLICYFFPLLGCAVASIPVCNWIANRFNLSPVTTLAIGFGVMSTLHWIFSFSPIIIYTAAIYAVWTDYDDLWKEYKRRKKQALDFIGKQRAKLTACQEKDDVVAITVPSAV